MRLLMRSARHSPLSRFGISAPALGLVLLAVAWRLVLFLFPATHMNSDNALYGLMARHIVEGRWPIFTYGQHYMGSLESIVGAAFFLVFGPGYHALQLSPLLFFALYLWVLWALGRELFGEVPALWALAYAAAAPFQLYVWSLAPRGGYAETLFFGTSVLLLTLRILARAGGGAQEWALLGLAAGLGFWTNFQIGSYCIPAGLLLLLGLRTRLVHARTLVGIVAFLVGSLPFWAYNLPRHFISLHMQAVGSLPLRKGFEIFAFRFVPDILGLAGPYLDDAPGGQRAWLILGGLAYLVLALAFLGFSLRALFGFLSRRRASPGEGLLLLFVATLALLVSASRYAQFASSRLVLPLHTVLPLLGACAIANATGALRRLAVAAWVALIVAQTGFLAVHLLAAHPVARREEAWTADLLRTLVAEGETRGIGDYGQAKRLSFLSEERVILAIPVNDQYPPHEMAVERSEKAFFLHHGGLSAALAARGFLATTRAFGPYRLSSAVEPPGERLTPIPAASLRLSGEGAAEGWADGVLPVAPARPRPGEATETVLDLGAVRSPALARLVFDPNGGYGSWEAWSSLDGQSWEPVLAAAVPEPLFVSGPRAYLDGMFRRAELRLRPLRARYLKVRRGPSAAGTGARVEELFLYESAAGPVRSGPSPEALEYLREKGVSFTYADRWESAAIVAALGAGRANQPHNRFFGRPDRTGYVGAPGRVAFLVPEEESAAVLEVLLPETVSEERVFDGYRVFLVDQPDGGPSGLRWAGFAPLFDGVEGRAIRLRLAALARSRRGDLPGAVSRLREAVGVAPGFYLAHRDLAALARRLDPAAAEAASSPWSAASPIEATFDGGLRLHGITLGRREKATTVAYLWEFDQVPPPGLFVVTRCEGGGRVAEEAHRLAEAAPESLMFSGNLLRDERPLAGTLAPGTAARCRTGLWNPRTRWRTKILGADRPVRLRRILFDAAGVP